ncbi:FAD-dependent oxidoreductase [Mucilaginibacter sp. S1162]|uniref:FAD-dependent oxidoreductase n=1 Tax=Mucilaginibacter humi TaxID=2732510 RepID=A0ABX1VZB7_9SPHI|nr:FAD-dependent oxidoreductase [Mucilaginibacter humi]NNU33279.1 FAD-dependent oxidoreductase [Mucilaginibacter humi]
MPKKYIAVVLLQMLILAFNSAAQVKTTHKFDIVIYGATPAGVSAAIQAARLGKSVTIVEPLASVGALWLTVWAVPMLIITRISK